MPLEGSLELSILSRCFMNNRVKNSGLLELGVVVSKI